MITVHEKTAQSFETLGLGALFPSSCIVTEELNGAYELELQHPYDEGGKWKRIEQECIIYASTPRGRQPFRIYNICPDMESIKVNARHIFYDLLDNQSWAVSFTGTADSILSEWSKLLYTEMPFTFETDMTHEGAMKTERMNPVQALLSDDDDMTSFVKGCGGEILRDHFNVSILAAMGQDRDVAIRYGKNLIGLEVTEDAADVKTRFLCYTPFESAVVDSPYIEQYVYPKIYTIEDDNKSIDELKAEAQEMLDGGADLPMVNIKVDFVELTKTVEYKDYAPLEKVFLGDTVTVINQKMNFAKKAKVISYEWNCLLNRYDEVELGDFMPSLAASVTSGAKSGSVASSASATAASVAALLNSHMTDYNNPHKVTVTQTGGSSSGSTGTDADAVLELLADHEENKYNPHEVTLAQVGFTSGTDDPDDANGNDGDIHLQIGSGESYHTIVEYLESTGTQFLDTKFKPSGGKLRVQIDFMYTKDHSGLSLFGNHTSAPFAITVYGTRPQFYVGSSNGVNCGPETALNTHYTLDVTVENGVLTAIWNGVEYTTTYSGSLYTALSMYIFGSNNNGVLAEADKGYRLFRYRMWDNDILVRDYIPIRDNNSIPCAYEQVEGKYYYNGGTGTFTAGAEVSRVSDAGSLWLKQNGTWTQVLKGAT